MDENVNANDVIDSNEISNQTTNQTKVDEYIASLKNEQNINKAILGGTLGMVIGAILWAVITVITGFQIGYMAIAIGFIVGFLVRTFGKGLDPVYGYIGAVFAILGCLFGNMLSIFGFATQEFGMSFFEVFANVDFSLVINIMIESFSPIDLLFYGIAIYEGYHFSFRQITEEELISQAQ